MQDPDPAAQLLKSEWLGIDPFLDAREFGSSDLHGEGLLGPGSADEEQGQDAKASGGQKTGFDSHEVFSSKGQCPADQS
jgi:hypothetical protein